jgi:5-methylcytosine-specific restriction endonuclease McrA
MSRKPNTDKNGGSWSEPTKRSVWNKGITIPGKDPNYYRLDKCGKTMSYNEHGNRNSSYGWEIDHINPVSNGGDDSINNLQPLHWENNANKSDKLNWTCS